MLIPSSFEVFDGQATTIHRISATGHEAFHVVDLKRRSLNILRSIGGATLKARVAELVLIGGVARIVRAGFVRGLTWVFPDEELTRIFSLTE